MAYSNYKAKEFKLSGLKGISDETLKMHFGLYEGYVKNTNLLTEQISEIIRNKEASGKDLAYAELTRRLGFEFGGIWRWDAQAKSPCYDASSGSPFRQ